MDDLTAFVEARLAEDQATAREAAGLTGCWIAEEPAIGVVLVGGEPLIEGHVVGLTAHIARHDPARALRQVAAIRAVIEMAEEHLYNVDDTYRLFAAIWSDHPDYREAVGE